MPLIGELRQPNNKKRQSIQHKNNQKDYLRTHIINKEDLRCKKDNH